MNWFIHLHFPEYELLVLVMYFIFASIWLGDRDPLAVAITWFVVLFGIIMGYFMELWLIKAEDHSWWVERE